MDEKRETKEKLPWNERFLEFVDGQEEHPIIFVFVHGILFFLLWRLRYAFFQFYDLDNFVSTAEFRALMDRIYHVLNIVQFMQLTLMIYATKHFFQDRKQKKKAQKEAEENQG